MNTDSKTQEEKQRQLIELWMSLHRADNTISAASLATSIFSVALETEDKNLEGIAVAWWKLIINKRYPESRSTTEPKCSFCGRSAPEVRITAGPGVFICNECVTTLNESFVKNTSNDT